ncbi:hypothetical protein [Streptomyces chryseus]
MTVVGAVMTAGLVAAMAVLVVIAATPKQPPGSEPADSHTPEEP